MTHLVRIVSLLVLAALIAACVPGAAAVPGQVLQSSKARQAAPQTAPADLAELASGNRAFAADLYQALDDRTGNLFFSPYSISLALAMTYAGARGETAAEMADALHFTLPGERLHPAFNAVDQELATRKDGGGQGADGKGFRLNVVNDLWGQKDYAFREEYLDLLAENYGAGLRLMDFQSDPQGSRKQINDYIAEKTEQRIKDLLPQDAVDDATRLVLTNAIYFNAAWEFTFDDHGTKDAPFTLLDGSQVNVPMMQMWMTPHLRYAKGDGYQAVALPYENQPISMYLLVPDEGHFEEFAASLDPGRLESITTEMESTMVHVRMPRFQVEDEFELKEVLGKLGMEAAFNMGQADFSGIDGSRDLLIDAVIHKAFVKVNEAGTEAAAATAVAMAAGAAPGEPVTLVVDRPFLFLIQDEPTGTILFMGQVTQPEE